MRNSPSQQSTALVSGSRAVEAVSTSRRPAARASEGQGEDQGTCMSRARRASDRKSVCGSKSSRPCVDQQDRARTMQKLSRRMGMAFRLPLITPIPKRRATPSPGSRWDARRKTAHTGSQDSSARGQPRHEAIFHGYDRVKCEGRRWMSSIMVVIPLVLGVSATTVRHIGCSLHCTALCIPRPTEVVGGGENSRKKGKGPRR